MPLLDLILVSGQSVNIQLGIDTKDATGGAQRVWPTQTISGQTVIPCIIRAPAASLVNDYAQRGIEVNCQVLFAFNVDAAVIGGLGATYRFYEPATKYVHVIKGTGLLNSLILSGEPVYRVDTYRRQAPN